MIYIAGDKHGFEVVKLVEGFLQSRGLEYKNLGVQNKDEEMTLEEMIPKVTSKVLQNEENKGVLTCGTGIGVEVGANKFSGIRACLATNEKIASWAVEKDKCNVLCLTAWDIDSERLDKILSAWFDARYDGSEKRLKMFEEFNKWH